MTEKDQQFFIYLTLSGLVTYCAIATWLLQFRLRKSTKRYYAWAAALTGGAISIALLTTTTGERPFFHIDVMRDWIVDSRQLQIPLYVILAFQLTAKLWHAHTGSIPRWLKFFTFVEEHDV